MQSSSCLCLVAWGSTDLKMKTLMAYINRRCGQLGLSEPANDPQRSETPTPIFFTKSALLLNPLSNQNRAQVAMETHCFGGIAGESYFNRTFNRTLMLSAQNKETSRT